MALYTAKDFTRLLGTPGFSDALLKQHFELYGGYVKNANAVHDELEAAAPAKPPTPAWSELKRRFGWEWNGMRLHEVYFGNLTKKRTNPEKTAGLGAQLAKDFGSRESWEKEFRATGSLRGIGWAALYADPEKKREQLFEVIRSEALAWSCAAVDHQEIDRINILEASLKAMKIAIESRGPWFSRSSRRKCTSRSTTASGLSPPRRPSA